VRVTKNDFFGPLVKDYVFTMVRDTTLASLTVDGTALKSFRPDVLTYTALSPADAGALPTVGAVARDPAATVVVDQAGASTGQVKVTVTNGGASTVYTVRFDTALAGSDEFESSEPGGQWRWVREDAGRWRLADGALSITSQSGDLQGSVNTARNIALQDVHGDWAVDSRVVFSRPIAANNEQGGVIAYADDDNYVKLAWEMADANAPVNKRRLVLLREQQGVVTTTQVTGAGAQRIVGADGALWLRLTKTGNTYKAYYSGDGATYRFMGATTLDAVPTGAGMVAFNRSGTSTDLDAAFDYFRVESMGEHIGRP
jgi:alpha-glucuronidase